MRKLGCTEFVARLEEAISHDRKYAFFLGAGCSVTSGIPGAASLVRDYWLPRWRALRHDDHVELTTWAKSVLADEYEPENAGNFYGRVIDGLFQTDDAKQAETEDLCDGRVPSFAYAT